MSDDQLKRRDFLKSTAVAGMAAPLLAGTVRCEPMQRGRPVVVSSANEARGANGDVFRGGLACVTRAMEIIKSGGDTLDAVIAGVNIVEDDPRDNSVGYGGLPNEEGD
ncbi:MAG: isoaspartyl peptidase/L-asparaginase, partial [Acidobacteriota bacterium]